MTDVAAPERSGRLLRLVAAALGATGAMATLSTATQQTVLGEYRARGHLPRPEPSPRGPAPSQAPDAILLALCRRITIEESSLLIPDIERDRMLSVELRGLGGFGVRTRAYAGVPLHDDGGETVGALCVAVPEPQTWTDEAVETLRDAADLLAGGVGDEPLRQLIAQHGEVERSRGFLDALLDSLETGVSACDAQGRLVLFNRAQRRIHGTEADNTPPARWAPRFHVRHLDGSPISQDEMPLIRALRGEAVRSQDLMITQADGQNRIFRVNAEPILSRTGEKLGAVAASHDITHVRRMERLHACEIAVARALAPAANAEQAVPAALEAMVRALGWAHAELWQVDQLGRVLRLAARWTVPGLSAEMDPAPAPLRRGTGLPGLAWQTGALLWAPELSAQDNPAPGSRIQAAVAIPVRGEPDLLGVLVAYTAVPEEPDDALRALLSGVAAHVGQFVERRRAEELATHLVRAKDDYIALVGHELRTPLTSIASYTQLLIETDDAVPLGDIRADLEVIGRNTQQLRGVVDDLLDLAALDSGHAVVRRGPVDLVPEVRASVEVLQAEAAGASVTMTTNLPDTAVVSGDRTRLRQLLDNILSNAVLYTPGGRVEVSCQMDDSTVLLEVSDNGPGIAAEERELVSRRFYRGRTALDRGVPGRGLGLAICGVIVERHGGTIGLAPAEGGGTTVQVRLPRPLRPLD